MPVLDVMCEIETCCDLRALGLVMANIACKACTQGPISDSRITSSPRKKSTQSSASKPSFR